MPSLSLTIPPSISADQHTISGQLHITSPVQHHIQSIQLSFQKTVQLVDKKGALENHEKILGNMTWEGHLPISPDTDFLWNFELPVHIVSPQNVPLKEEGRLGKILQRIETKLTSEYPSHQLLVEVSLSNGEVLRQTEALQVRY